MGKKRGQSNENKSAQSVESKDDVLHRGNLLMNPVKFRHTNRHSLCRFLNRDKYDKT